MHRFIALWLNAYNYIYDFVITLLQTDAGSQVLLENTERFAELLAMSQNNSDSGEPVRISRPNIGE